MYKLRNIYNYSRLSTQLALMCPRLIAAYSNLSNTCGSLRFPFSDFKHF